MCAQSLPARLGFWENRHNLKSKLCINMRYMLSCSAVPKQQQSCACLEADCHRTFTGVGVGLYPKCHCPCRVVCWVSNCSGEGGWGGDVWEMTQRPQGRVSPHIMLNTSTMPRKKTQGRAERTSPAILVTGVQATENLYLGLSMAGSNNPFFGSWFLAYLSVQLMLQLQNHGSSFGPQILGL